MITRDEFQEWARSILTSNRMMHMLDATGDGRYGCCALPVLVRPLDARAAELLEKVRAAHDNLTNYLQGRTDEV